MTKIDTSKIKPQKKLFHNVLVDVYPTTLALEEIEYWKGNNRTLFSFEILQRQKEKTLAELSIEEITTFVADQKIHKLSALADSIKRNGVQVPLIIRDDGLLLDGNRRYFACQWLKMSSRKIENQNVLSEIPVMIVRNRDITHEIELKILAEANFIPDLKVPWPLDAQARAVDDFFQNMLKKKGIDKDNALNEVSNIFGITRARVTDLLDTLELTKVFISEGKKIEEENQRRGIVEEKFVYFWEFRNKAMKGRSKYSDHEELREVKNMFFSLMAMGKSSPVKNVKQVEPLAQSKRDKTAWNIMKESEGSKLSIVVSMINDKKEVRKAEDKIRLFNAWLVDLEVMDLSSTAKSYLLKLKNLLEEKSKDAES
jgi:ParB-like nuclease family protein